ncbi:MAG TPA: hypothetical protein VFB22_15620 [Candidatus Baltobacteraceae bacterium]|nr:hypothetical protein [Candidatus Baltobacteraceae bacterium]
MRLARVRGSALPETAVCIGVALTLLFGALEFALLGYDQVNADGAAWLAAHEAGLGLSTTSVTNAVKTPFGAAAANGVALNALPPDDTTVPVDYDYQQQGQRHGGASLVREAHEAATVTTAGVSPFVGALGKAAQVASSVIEPSVVFTNFGYDVQGVGYNTNSGVFNNHNAYFTTDANVPPYYVGFAFMQYCPTGTAFTASCSGQKSVDLGLAEYLDDDNYGASLTGVQTGGTFATMACHQREYVKLLNDVFTSSTLESNSPTLSKYNETQQADLVAIYHWDSTYDGALHPTNGC